MGITLADTLISASITNAEPVITANTDTSADSSDSLSFTLTSQTSADEENTDAPCPIPSLDAIPLSDEADSSAMASNTSDDTEALARMNWVNQPSGFPQEWGISDTSESMPVESADSAQCDELTNVTSESTDTRDLSNIREYQGQTRQSQQEPLRAETGESSALSDQFALQPVVDLPSQTSINTSELSNTTNQREESADDGLNDSNFVSIFTPSNNNMMVMSSDKRSSTNNHASTDNVSATESSTTLFANTIDIQSVPVAQISVSTTTDLTNQNLLMTEFATTTPSLSEKGTKTLLDNMSLSQNPSNISTSNADRVLFTLNSTDTTSFQFSASDFTTQQTSVSSQLGHTMLTMLKDQVQLQLTQNTQQATIRLDPPSLGHLQITVTQRNDVVSVQITASHDGLRQALQESRDQLKLVLSAQNTGQIDVEINQEHRESPYQSATAYPDDEPIRASSIYQTDQTMPSSPSSATENHWLNTVV